MAHVSGLLEVVAKAGPPQIEEARGTEPGGFCVFCLLSFIFLCKLTVEILLALVSFDTCFCVAVFKKYCWPYVCLDGNCSHKFPLPNPLALAITVTGRVLWPARPGPNEGTVLTRRLAGSVSYFVSHSVSSFWL